MSAVYIPDGLPRGSEKTRGLRVARRGAPPPPGAGGAVCAAGRSSALGVASGPSGLRAEAAVTGHGADGGAKPRIGERKETGMEVLKALTVTLRAAHRI